MLFFTLTHLSTLLCISITISNMIVQSNAQTNIDITLSHGGIIRGQEETVIINGNTIQVNHFLGIPYAMPPIGELRFAPPKKHPGWTGLRNATKLPATCWQYIFGGFDAVNPAGKMWINNTEMNEDCLYMNIWTPKSTTTTAAPGAVNNQRFPVMVWIYGGGFTSGSANLQVYNGAILAAKQNVIIVSMQYRVGAFGFLRLNPNVGNNHSQLESEQQSIALGNQGLLDQLMSLQWVHENIQHFNGDPNQVTLFGESAGAVSVSILWMSPMAQPYFQRAILQSGSVYARWALDSANEAHGKAVEFALACGCKSPSLDRNASLRCLQNLDPLTLVNQLDSINTAIGQRRQHTFQQCLHRKDESTLLLPGQSTSTRLYFDVPLKPVIDGLLIPKHPDAIFNNAKNSSAFKSNPELLIGVNENEAMFFILPGISINNTQFLYPNGTVDLPNTIQLAAAAGNRQPSQIDTKDELADFYWITTTQMLDESQMRLGLAKIPAYYYNLPIRSTSTSGFQDPDTMKMTAEELMQRLDRLAGDLDFACPTLNFAEHVARLPNAKVFLYRFNKRTKALPLPKWTGVMHGYEIEYIFGMPYDAKFSKEFYKFTEDEEQMSSLLMKLWTNFAKTGNPSKDENNILQKPEWPLYRRTDELITSESDYLLIEDELKPATGLRRDRCRFWLHEMNDLANILQNTCDLRSAGIKPIGNYILFTGLWFILFIWIFIS
ncbi:unnamed protein product [Schistosoma turkestanicum]|nr:unnamed protein product [Schistosoma turkestanicum]